MDRIFGTVAAMGRVKFRWDDDFTDRVSRVYSTGILVVFAIVVSTKQNVGDPIACWVPGHWPSAHQRYTDNVCWIINTYWIATGEEIPVDIRHREDRQIGYYQWAAFALLFQALLFFGPCMFWRGLSDKSGINIKNIVDISVDAQNLNQDNRKKAVHNIAKHLHNCLNIRRDFRTGCFARVRTFISSKMCCFLWSRRHGNFLCVLYLIAKFLYLVNVVVQLVFMNWFLGTSNTLYGIQYFTDLTSGEDWTDTGRFPRITLCDFVIRVLGNSHRHTVQCVLPINLFNEKIYLFLWFWFIVVSLATLYSFITWSWTLSLDSMRIHYVRRLLDQLDHLDQDDERLLRKFAIAYLRLDGVLVVKLIEKNAGNVIVTEVMQELYADFVAQQQTVTYPYPLGPYPGGASVPAATYPGTPPPRTKPRLKPKPPSRGDDMRNHENFEV